MSENPWHRAASYSMAVAVAAVSYFFAQTAIDSRRATLPLIEYINCLDKLQNYDWSRFQGEEPPVSDTCKTLASREPTDS